MTDHEPVLWLDPGFGASGDMVLGTLIGLGAPVDEIVAGLAALAVDGWTLGHEQVTRGSIGADRAVVTTVEQHHHRTWTSIDRLLAGSDLPAAVVDGARTTFRRLGEVEAGIHHTTIDEVHFHEVGAVDAIVDIVGCWLALDLLGSPRVTVGPIGLGHGTVEAAHGTLPLPAPATAELLVGAAVKPVPVEAETVTPTGAALLATMADRWGPMPTGTLLALARGAGGRDPDAYPNVLTGYLLASAVTGLDGPAAATAAIVVTTNVDDVTPEVVGHLIARCLDLGADDAWATPIVMKKSRPAVELSVLCRPALLDTMMATIFAETGTLGLRTLPVTKHVLPRRSEAVEVRGHTIRMKVGPYNVKPEYEDLAAAAAALDEPIRGLSAEAIAIWRSSSPDDSPLN